MFIGASGNSAPGSRLWYGPQPPASTRLPGSDSLMITLTYAGGEPIARDTAATTRERSSARCLSLSGCRSIWISGIVSGVRV
jgi:hypothetical protein